MLQRVTLLLLLAILIAACSPCTCTQPTPTEVPTPIETPTPFPTLQPPTSSRTRIFYNVNGQGLQDEATLLEHSARVRPSTVLVMDNFGLAVKFAKQGVPYVIVRSYSSYEGGQCLQDNPASQVDRFVNELDRYRDDNNQPLTAELRSRLYYYGCSNEPSYGQANTITQILNAEIVGMRRANERGVKICSGNFGVGNFDPNHIDGGLYDSYLRVLIEGGHLLCVHEYTSLTLAFGVGLTMSRADLLDPTRVQTNNWATNIQPQRIQVPTFAQNENIPAGYEALLEYYSSPRAQAGGGMLPPYWHLFRVYWLFIRAAEIGLPYPYVVITEGLHDHLDDINRESPPALAILDSQWGILRPDGDFNLRGAPAHCRLWEGFYYPQWSCEEALLKQYLWWDTVAHPNILGVNIFTWSWNDNWIAFDLSNRQRLMNVFAFRQLFEACYRNGVRTCQFQS